MKTTIKTLLLTLFLFGCINSEIKITPRKANAQSIFAASQYDFRYSYHKKIIKGMDYGIWALEGYNTTTSTGYAIAVVNLTKDSLECEYFKKQLKINNE